MAEQTMQLYTVNGGKPSARVPQRRYDAVHDAIVAALREAPDGLGLWELCTALAPRLPQWWFDEGWDTPWHVTGVKLHMEYLGELSRKPGKGGHKVVLNSKGPATAPARGTNKQDGRAEAPAPSKKNQVPAKKSPKSPKEMHETMQRNLPEKTGRTMAEWAKLVRAAGKTEWKEAQAWLKQEHGLGTNYAYMVAGVACEREARHDYTDEEGLLSAMYAGPRALLRPIHDKLWEAAKKLGPEVQLVVCATYVSFRGITQFAVIKPTTQTAVDLGLALPPDTPYTERLVEAKNLGGGERNRHRIRLGSVKEIDAEVKRWLKAAYEWDLQRNTKKPKGAAR